MTNRPYLTLTLSLPLGRAGEGTAAVRFSSVDAAGK